MNFRVVNKIVSKEWTGWRAIGNTRAMDHGPEPQKSCLSIRFRTQCKHCTRWNITCFSCGTSDLTQLTLKKKSFAYAASWSKPEAMSWSTQPDMYHSHCSCKSSPLGCRPFLQVAVEVSRCLWRGFPRWHPSQCGKWLARRMHTAVN